MGNELDGDCVVVTSGDPGVEFSLLYVIVSFEYE